MTPGTTVFCRLTGKKMIIQTVISKTDSNPNFMYPETIIEKYTCRYWSKIEDKFYSTTVYPEEIQLIKPKFDYQKYDSLKK